MLSIKIWLIILFVVATFVVIMIFKKSRRDALYQAKKLLTGNELEFYIRLRRALPGSIIMAQVSMGALLEVSARIKDQRTRLSLRSKFSQKIIDFVVCDSKMNVLVLIELDDKTHRSDLDAARDKITADAGYKTLRFQSKSKPTEEEIKAACGA